MPSWIPEMFLAVLVIVFNAGGFYYLMRNHFPHVNRKLDQLLRIQNFHGERISRIEGALGLSPSHQHLTEH